MSMKKPHDNMNYFRTRKFSLYLADEDTKALYDLGLNKTILLMFFSIFLMFYIGFATAYYIFEVME